jgi:D-glycero-alpha-D-manno-heptose-7-phosphate kinase
MQKRKLDVPPRKSSGSIVAQAPCRVDLAGGTMDLWPLYLFHPGAVTVNFAVNILTTCRITPLRGRAIELQSIDTGREQSFADLGELCRISAKRLRHPIAAWLLRFFAPQSGLRVETHSESPAGAGISGSSALMVATTAALARFTGHRLSREEMRIVAQNVEAQIIGVPTGCQDYYPALYGGVNAIRLGIDGIRREAVAVAPGEIESRCVLVYTGAPRQSGTNNWEVFKAHLDGDARVRRNFDEIGRIARAMHQALSRAAWDDVVRLLREEWKLRKTNAPGISTPAIERLIAAGMKHGGRAAKVCGAGGGGCIIIWTDPDARVRVADVLRAQGGQVLPFRVARQGLTVYPPWRQS